MTTPAWVKAKELQHPGLYTTPGQRINQTKQSLYPDEKPEVKPPAPRKKRSKKRGVDKQT